MDGINGLCPQTEPEDISNLWQIVKDLMSERNIINGLKKEQVFKMTAFEKIEFLENTIRHNYWRFIITKEETLLIRSFLEKICKYDFWGETDRKIGIETTED